MLALRKIYKMLPVRCFSCNKVLGHLDHVFKEYRQKNDDLAPFFETYSIRKYCCRKIFLTNVNIYDFCADFNHDNIICKSASEVVNILKTD